MENNNELKIITDETLMEKRNHGQPAFPFQYYLEDIWDFDFHTLGWHWHQEIEFVYVQSTLLCRKRSFFSASRQRLIYQYENTTSIYSRAPHRDT